MKILVTGSSGYLGEALVRTLKQQCMAGVDAVLHATIIIQRTKQELCNGVKLKKYSRAIEISRKQSIC